MRALRVHAAGDPAEVLKLEEIAPPEPGPGQVRIRVAAAALNFGDALLCRGLYHLRPPWPFTPGLEVAGAIDAVGPDVSLPVGLRVMAVPDLPDGGLAEQALAGVANVYPAPDAMGDAEAAGFLIPFQTGHVALHRRGGIRAGETLLVHAGAGGVGSAAIQLGVAAGARVFATAGSESKLGICRELGAERAIDYRSEDFGEAVKEATGGEGVDLVYDSVGGEVFDRSLRCLAWEGRLLVVGFAGGDVAQAATHRVLLRNVSVVGVYMGEYSRRERPFLDAVHEELLGLYAAGRIRTVVGREIGLEEVADGLADLAGRRTVGKLIVRP